MGFRGTKLRAAPGSPTTSYATGPNTVRLIRHYKAYLLQQKVASLFVKNCSVCYLCPIFVCISFHSKFAESIFGNMMNVDIPQIDC